jgi:group I intron endonuclease
VYQHINKKNGKRYIGLTADVTVRWRGNGKEYKGCPRFMGAIRKYGWDGFEHEILEDGLTAEEAMDLERYYIELYKTQKRKYGYNIMPGGDARPSMLGKHHTEEAKAKIRKKMMGRMLSEEQRRQHGIWMHENMRGARNGKSKAVRCIETGIVYESQRQAADATGTLQSGISRCCSGEISYTNGLHWEYVNDVEA